MSPPASNRVADLHFTSLAAGDAYELIVHFPLVPYSRTSDDIS